ncbi:polysaccharide deacetylase family protein [Micromonospora sp. CPCC 205711]|uniref:polysaccharide deacetylase family protein n=1 Tax=Micromonospora sp. CPCC 205547 TaxID=3122400 RepID=UPI002FF2AE91
MRPPPVLAVALGLVLLLAGCGEQTGTTPQADGATAAATPSAPLPPEPTRTPPAPRPTPKPSAKPPLRALPAKLPAGLNRTTGVRGVALTFDDGPSAAWTPKVLDQLHAAHVTATFCVVGVQVRRHPQLVARIVREGHQLCNHSWRHDMDLGRRPVAEIRADMIRTNEAIRRAVPGAKVPFFRQPGGRWTAEEIAVARQLGMRPLHWSVDPQDWAKPTTPTIIHRVEGAARPGAVILMHDGGGNRGGTLAACPHLISDLKRRYGIVPLR